MSDISLWLRSPLNTLQVPGLPLAYCEWTLQENTFHVLKASGPIVGVDPSLFVEDARFDILHSIAGGAAFLEGRTQFALRYWKISKYGWEIEAYSPEYILTGRTADYSASTAETTNPYTTKSGIAGNVMKAIVRENLGSLATLPERRLSNLIVEDDNDGGASVEKSFARREILTVLQELAEDSSNQGVWMSFGFVVDPFANTYTFKTWPNQRGINHAMGSSDEIIVSEAFKNLKDDWEVISDHRTEYTAVRAGGLGQGDDRVTYRVEDTTRSQRSPLAYREKFKDGRQSESSTILEADARAELEASRPIRGFSGTMLETENSRYGLRFFFGDLVTAQAAGFSFTCRLETVKGTWSREGGKAITIALVGQEDL